MGSMLEYKGYHATVSYDAEDEILVGEVFGISDFIGFHASSIMDLKTKFAQAIDRYLEYCEEIGKNPEKEFKGSFNVRIPPELHKQVSLMAAQQQITLNQFIINSLSKSVSK